MNARLLLASFALASTTFAIAQTAPPPPAAGAPVDGAAPIVRQHSARPMREERDRQGMPGGDMQGMGGRLLPPGPWWRDTALAGRIGLNAEQTKRIDEIFLQARVQLIHMHASLEEEQLMLEPLLNANPVDQGKALAHIGKIADTRADLEKADAKMLLSIRGVLSAEQWTKLQAERHGPREAHRMGGSGERGFGPMGAGGREPARAPGPPQPPSQ